MSSTRPSGCVLATPTLKDVPIIFQTAFPSQEHGRRTVDVGESYMLCKPFDAGLFVKVVQRCLSEGSSSPKCEHEKTVVAD